MERLLNELRKRRRNQKGFTLIEMLVVISILGILAAVVTLSMVGITSVAKSRATAEELQTIQVAMDAMAADQGLTQQGVCPTPAPGTTRATATQDMQTWPSTTALYPNYIHTKSASQQFYWCETNGTVHGTVSG